MMDLDVTKQPKSDIGVEFIKTTANTYFESESDNEYIKDHATDESPNWLTCARELFIFGRKFEIGIQFT